MKCYTCEKGNLENKKVKYSIYGIDIGIYPAQVCSECNEVFFSEETSKKITKKTKELGLWGLEAKTKVGVAGTTLDIRLSKKLIDFFRLKKGMDVRMYPENKEKLVVELKQ